VDISFRQLGEFMMNKPILNLLSILIFLCLSGCVSSKYPCDVIDIKQTEKMWAKLEYIFTTKDNVSIFIAYRFKELPGTAGPNTMTEICEPEIVAVDSRLTPVSPDVMKGDLIRFDTKTNTIEKLVRNGVKAE